MIYTMNSSFSTDVKQWADANFRLNNGFICYIVLLYLLE